MFRRDAIAEIFAASPLTMRCARGASSAPQSCGVQAPGEAGGQGSESIFVARKEGPPRLPFRVRPLRPSACPRALPSDPLVAQPPFRGPMPQ